MLISAGANETAVITFSQPIFATYDSGSFGQRFACQVLGGSGSTLTTSGGQPNLQLTGGTFILGSTTIQCQAVDVVPNGVSITHTEFMVTVVDQPASFFNVPSTIAVDATSKAGATVTYTAPTAFEDSESEVIPVTCLPASGSVFGINAPGNFIPVKCTAKDADAGSSTATFLVHVRGAAEQIPNLIALVDSIPGAKQSFEDQLQMALADLNAGNIAQACGDLTGFINHVMAQSGKQLTVAQANQLIAAAKQIRAVLGCK